MFWVKPYGILCTRRESGFSRSGNLMNHDRCTWTDAGRCIGVAAVVVEGWFLEALLQLLHSSQWTKKQGHQLKVRMEKRCWCSRGDERYEIIVWNCKLWYTIGKSFWMGSDSIIINSYKLKHYSPRKIWACLNSLLTRPKSWQFFSMT